MKKEYELLMGIVELFKYAIEFWIAVAKSAFQSAKEHVDALLTVICVGMVLVTVLIGLYIL